MKKTLLLIFSCLVVLLPNLAFAIEWSSAAEDQSIYLLGVIFGPVGNVLVGAGNQLVGDIFKIFNIAVLTIGSTVVMYSIIVSTISTAQEGEVMGKKWSSVWIPLRASTGVALLIPTASGYSLIQLLMMQMILQSIHAGNAMWGIVLDNAETGTYLTNQTEVKPEALTQASLNLFYGLVCKQMLNSPAYSNHVNGQTVTMYRSGSRMNIGVEGNSGLSKACGSFNVAAKPQEVVNTSAWLESQFSSLEFGESALDPYAQEAALEPDPASWLGNGVIASGRNAIRGPIINTPIDVRGMHNRGDYEEMLTHARQDGWIFAGTYYFKLQEVEGAPNTTFYPPQWAGNQNTPISWNTIVGKANAYLTETDLGIGEEPREEIALGPTPNLRDGALRMWDNMAINQGMRDVLGLFLEHLSERETSPTLSFAKVGSEIMVTIETLFFIALMAAFAVMIGGCISAATAPLCWALGALLGIIIPILTFLTSTLWAAGLSLGIYLPMVPYLVFTFTALGWLLLVIEAMVAAPVVALGFISPGADQLGRAAPAVLLITNVFLKPSLMIIGFVIASRLVVAVISMINFSFMGVVEASISGLGLFGVLALVVIYSGICITAMHQCYALIYQLPDKIIRWIGGQAEQSMTERAMQETQKAADQAAKQTGEGMKFATEFMKKQQSKAMSKSMSGGIEGLSM